jgi:hypothetical protein
MTDKTMEITIEIRQPIPDILMVKTLLPLNGRAAPGWAG